MPSMSYLRTAILSLTLSGCLTVGQKSTSEWLLEAILPATGANYEGSVAHRTQHNVVSTSGITKADLMAHTSSPWERDGETLSRRLEDLKKFAQIHANNESKRGYWPHGRDFDLEVGVDSTLFAEPEMDRCARLSSCSWRPTSDAGPIAILLTGQLRTAEICLPFLEENVIRATLPTEVEVFAHVWALSGRKSGELYLKHAAPKHHNGSGGTATEGSEKKALAGIRAEERLRRVPGLKAIVVEAEEDFEAIVTRFYDEKYGSGWMERRAAGQRSFWVTATATFLSQWYKVSAGHGLMRRWYRSQRSIQGASYSPPRAILRLRPDHLITSRWNLSRAAFEFSARAASKAAGGNFIALWGPTTHSEFCGPDLCQDRIIKRQPAKASPSGFKCYANGRLDDAFAFGSPPAMDVYSAPYHPYQTKCCEEYVTSTLSLGNLVQVGAVASMGGEFGSVGMPGSCHHRMGHYPIVEKTANSSSRFLEYTAQYLEGTEDEGSDARKRARNAYHAVVATPPDIPLVPGPFTNAASSVDAHLDTSVVARKRRPTRVAPFNASHVTSHRHVQTLPHGNSLYENRAGLLFDKLCAPVFYFSKYGVQILRFKSAVDVARREQHALSLTGACPPHIVKGEDGFCTDVRHKRAKAFPWLKDQIRVAEACGKCGNATMLEIDFGGPSSDSNGNGGLKEAFESHCSRATGFENRACNTRV